MKQVYPLEFFISVNGSTPPPRDPLLFEAVQKFCKEQFGAEREFHNDVKTWVVAEHGDAGYLVHGITSLRVMLDCYTFHVRPPGDDRESRDEAVQVRNKLLERAVSFIQDKYGCHSRVLVYVDSKVERFWRGFLRLIGAKPAGRWEVEV